MVFEESYFSEPLFIYTVKESINKDKRECHFKQKKHKLVQSWNLSSDFLTMVTFQYSGLGIPSDGAEVRMLRI